MQKTPVLHAPTPLPILYRQVFFMCLQHTWFSLLTHAGAIGPCLCVYGALFILSLYASYCSQIIILTQSVNTGMSCWPLPVCIVHCFSYIYMHIIVCKSYM